MKAPRQWINSWQKEDPKKIDLVDCSMHVTKIVDKRLKRKTYLNLKIKHIIQNKAIIQNLVGVQRLPRLGVIWSNWTSMDIPLMKLISMISHQWNQFSWIYHRLNRFPLISINYTRLIFICGQQQIRMQHSFPSRPCMWFLQDFVCYRRHFERFSIQHLKLFKPSFCL